MLDLSLSKQLATNNKRSFTMLKRAIAFSQGQFSLILVSCNQPQLRQQTAKLLREDLEIEIQDIVVSPTSQTLLTTILKKLKNPQPQALMVFGLESVLDIDKVLISTNLVRNDFSKRFNCPVVLWVNDEIMRKMTRLAPDFKNWAGNTIRFETQNNQLIEWEALTA